ncbi:MAG: hypothetical protein K8E24_012675 [Methanobacterium paludis]|nr:hypothetical protein [Methanobacterium paludis]
MLRQSEDPERRSIADLFSAVSDLRSYLVRIEKAVTNSERSVFPELSEKLIKPNPFVYPLESSDNVKKRGNWDLYKNSYNESWDENKSKKY